MYKELIPCRKSEENWNRLYDNINYLYDDYWIVMANSNTYGKMPDEIKERFIALQNTIKSTNTELMKLEPVLSTYKRAVDAGKELNEKQMTYYQYLVVQVKSLNKTLASAQSEIGGLQQKILRSNNSKVVVEKDIFPGSIVTISELSTTIQSKRSFCQFRKKLGEIEISNL